MRANGGSKCVVLFKHWPNLFPLLFYFFHTVRQWDSETSVKTTG